MLNDRLTMQSKQGSEQHSARIALAFSKSCWLLASSAARSPASGQSSGKTPRAVALMQG